MRRTVGEAARAMGGRLLSGDAEVPWTRATLDSRKVEGGELFFALRGEQVDGHDFVPSALERGAAAAIVERDVPLPALDAAEPARGAAVGETPAMPSGAVIRVPAVYDALHALTRAVRAEVPEHVVGITGSSGKTTTKELLALCLAQRYRVAKTQGNLNNLLGFPLTLLGTAPGTEWLVAEMGMSLSGELGQISRMARPEVAVYTNVRPVHLEGLGSLAAIARAKSELLEGLAPEGTVIANAEDEWVRWIAETHAERQRAAGNNRARIVWYGGDSAYRITDVQARAMEGASAGGTRFTLHTPEGEAVVELPLHGAYNAENFLTAATTAHVLGVPLASLVAAARAAAPVGGRGAVTRLPSGVTLVDDSYNSNPVALRKALESARELPGERHWCVLGDMRELGPEAPRFHREEGEAAARLGFAPIWGIGALSESLVQGARDAGAEARWFATAEDAAAPAAEALRPGDVVLVKGSRGVRLERVVAALRRAGGLRDDGGGAH